MNREERVKIYADTVESVKRGFYVKNNGKIVIIPTLPQPSSKFYNKEINIESANAYDEKVEVENNDCFYVAKRLKDEGLSPAVLNMANRHMPGGGVLRGSGAQEENICRRSNLFQSLYSYHPISKSFGFDENKRFHYPMNEDFGGIYSKNIVVFRNSEDKKYSFLDKPFMIDVISVAAINRPELTENGKFKNFVEKREKNKIRTILNIALDNGNDSLVLGAFGCGAFRTPPYEMARCFYEVLKEKKYTNKFKKIVFAILDDHNSHKEHNPEGNYAPFKKMFSNF